MSTIPGAADLITEASAEESAKLRRHFGRFDVFFFLVCTIVGLDTIGSVASNGAQGFTWLIFLSVLFFAPYALLTAELGSAFPAEGGPYVWTRMAFGRFAAAVNAVIYWAANPIWLGGSLTITAVSVFGEFFTPLGGVGKWLFAIVFIWIGVFSAILSLDKGKWLPTVGAFVRIVLLSVFVVTVIVYAFEHGVHGFGVGSFSPTYGVFIAAVPVLFFNYVGFELPSAAGEELKNPQRDVPFTVVRSALVAVFLYGGPVLAILLVLPISQVTNLGGFIDAIKTVFTVYGGHVAHDGTATLSGFGKVLGDVAALGFIIALLTSGITWIMGSDRAQAVACYDGGGPRRLGVISERFGTPVAMNITSGFLATAVMILAFTLTSGNGSKYFTAVLGLAISTTTISYLLIFPALARLRFTHADVPRPYRVPGGRGVAIFVSALCCLWALLATVCLLWPGFGTSAPDSALPQGFGGQRLQYELSQFLPLVVLLAIGVLFYVLGGHTRRHMVSLRTQGPVGSGAAPAGAAAAPSTT
jgi:amino acid transporter